ncbi:MAG: hypothetical protein DRQ13_12790, partial [Ignavibacteriae bacterium]
NNDGSTVTYNVNGNVISRTFYKDTTGYQSYDVDSLSGVIIDVDEFDWAVPGNGILIWHIDENVIAEKEADNKINTDKDKRGVDIEEADGVQDIGVQFQTILGDIVIGEGTEEDMWHASNPTELFENRFAKDTRPNTLTNSGANSLITIKDFSEISNKMSFNVEFGDSVIKPFFSTLFNFGPNIKGFSSRNTMWGDFNIVSDDSLHLVRYHDIWRTLPLFSSLKSAFIYFNDCDHTYGILDSLLNYHVIEYTTPLRIHEGSLTFETNLTCPSAINILNENESELLIGDDKGNIYFIRLARTTPSFEEPIIERIVTLPQMASAKKISVNESYFSAIFEPDLNLYEYSQPLFIDAEGVAPFDNYEFPIDLAITKNDDGYFSIVLTDKKKFYGFRGNNKLFEFALNYGETVESFALADLKQNGTNYIVLNNEKSLEVYNQNGAMADNFPFIDPEGVGFVGTPLTTDFEGDNASEIISITEDGRIFAIDGGTGKIVPGFPISVGGTVSVTPVLFNDYYGITKLAVLNDQNVLSAWSISSVEGKLFWSEEFGNPQNTSFVDAAENTNRINEFFPSGRAYNYPNPVYDGETFIRYYVSEDSKINIKIFDLAGDYVAELNDDARGGMDNETIWNVTDIQSGVYLARIEATSNSGKSEYAIIKIAVVK